MAGYPYGARVSGSLCPRLTLAIRPDSSSCSILDGHRGGTRRSREFATTSSEASDRLSDAQGACRLQR